MSVTKIKLPDGGWVYVGGGAEGPQGPQGPEGPEGKEGPVGPAGPEGSAFLATTYDWASETGPPAPGQVTGEEIAGSLRPSTFEVQLAGEFSINQIDKDGLNNSFFHVAVGDTLIVRDTVDGGLHELTVISRVVDAGGEFVTFGYTVESTTGTSVVGREVSMALHAIRRGEIAPPAVIHMTFTFATPTTEWMIIHDLNSFYVEINCYDLAGAVEYDPEIEFVDANTAIVKWYNPMAGIARIIS